MREAAADIMLPGISDLAAAERMSREIAMLSGRLAHLLAASPAAHDEQIVRAHTFLHAMYEEVTAGGTLSRTEPAVRRLRGDEQAIDRIGEALLLDSGEIELILLAAMAEEHEGYASVLRSLNPVNEPYATVGLAAQLCCKNQSDRAALH